ncbi:MAG: lactate utilization protein B/C [Flavobacteriaceae bacterium]|jgi:L-lactate utilization protein LutB|nr:lactate utilization protein B/C [Flavobacteriaceae bacterium]|tara:strand:- start:1849 stop:2457 length:609 start_codon:yes stop_codon:yes gene_type:complete
MNLFRKIFSAKSKEEKKIPEEEERDKYLPKKELPVDELFTVNFNQNGGKFLYSESLEEAQEFLEKILEENNWKDKTALILNSKLKQKFKNFEWQTTKNINDGYFLFTTCEYLIANDGSLLISSNQIAEKKLKELPKNFIVFASTSQIVQTIGQGLQGIKVKNKKKIPSNITTIKHFKIDDEANFMNYGSSTKNLYLLLLEDL